MDAATLYVVLTLPNGEQRTSSKEFSTLRACEVQVDLRQHVPEPTGAVTTYRCAEHKTRPSIYLVACGPRAKPCEYLGPLSRRGCSAHLINLVAMAHYHDKQVEWLNGTAAALCLVVAVLAYRRRPRRKGTSRFGS